MRTIWIPKPTRTSVRRTMSSGSSKVSERRISRCCPTSQATNTRRLLDACWPRRQRCRVGAQLSFRSALRSDHGAPQPATDPHPLGPSHPVVPRGARLADVEDSERRSPNGRARGPRAGTPMKSYQQLFAELKRRNVFKVAAVYGARRLRADPGGRPAGQGAAAAGRLPAVRRRHPPARLPARAGPRVGVRAHPGGRARGPRPAARTRSRRSSRSPPPQRWPAGLLALAGVAALLAGAWWAGPRTGAARRRTTPRTSRRRRAVAARVRRPGRGRAAVDRRAPVRRHEPRGRPGVLQRRDHRGDPQHPGEDPRAEGGGPDVGLRLQGTQTSTSARSATASASAT